jgi:transcriptional regulator of acetoin/glycerol metabolism
VFREAQPIDCENAPSTPSVVSSDGHVPAYDEARRLALAQFEVGYLNALLQAHHGKVAAAARTAGVDRAYLYRLMKRHGVG